VIEQGVPVSALGVVLVGFFVVVDLLVLGFVVVDGGVVVLGGAVVVVVGAASLVVAGVLCTATACTFALPPEPQPTSAAAAATPVNASQILFARTTPPGVRNSVVTPT